MQVDDIAALSRQELIEHICTLAESDENKSRIERWKVNEGAAEAYWHGYPRKGMDHIPFTVDIEHNMWGTLFGYEMDAYYLDSSIYLEAELRSKVYRFHNFHDDTPIGTSLSVWLGSGFEASLFGMEQRYKKDQDPWIGREPLIDNKKKLANLSIPDFYQTGPMPKIHDFYKKVRRALDDSFSLIMIDWCRGPFGLACHLRGMDQLVMDMITDPPFAHDLLRFVVQARKEWVKQRSAFASTALQPACLYNDEVTVPVLSPALYERFVLPYEIELSEFYGGISYWHSCGNISGLQELITRIPRVEMIHVSPWTDLASTVEILADSRIALELVLHPIDDVQKADERGIEKKLQYIKELTKGLQVTVRADALQVIKSIDEDLEQIQKWTKKARAIL